MSGFVPSDIYAAGPTDGKKTSALISPAKYIQGEGVLDHLGEYLKVFDSKRVGILASRRGHETQGLRVVDSLKKSGCVSVLSIFEGECCRDAINFHLNELQSESVDTLVSLGGGKCVDAGKCVASRLEITSVIVPTLASNDAPCSAVSALYTNQGVMDGVEFFASSPSLVLVDTGVIAQAPPRYLVAGMGDAMATWYESRVCMNNPEGTTILGVRPTLAASAMGELCSKILFEEGEQALAATKRSEVNLSLEKVVEANTLLSGVGFESGGLAGAHGFAHGYTHVPIVEERYLHGEMVAMGVQAQLMMEKDVFEADRVAKFFSRVGLPVCLSQMSLSRFDNAALNSVVEGALGYQAFRNFPFDVTAEKLRKAIIDADELGRQIVRFKGDRAYKYFHDR